VVFNNRRLFHATCATTATCKAASAVLQHLYAAMYPLDFCSCHCFQLSKVNRVNSKRST
jgi:hypothetical protein